MQCNPSQFGLGQRLWINPNNKCTYSTAINYLRVSQSVHFILSGKFTAHLMLVENFIQLLTELASENGKRAGEQTL